MLVKTFRAILTKSNVSIFQNRLCATSADTKISTNAEVSAIAENCETRLLRTAVIGLPNSGKSTFINNLMDRKVCPASSKVHTTRCKAKAIFTKDKTQIVFLDTPGLVSDKELKQYNLEKSFIRDSRKMSQEADLIAVIHDVSNVWTRQKLDIKIINILNKHVTKPSILLFNKVDALKSKRKLLDLTRLVTENCLGGKPILGGDTPDAEDLENKGWPYFQDIFMISALTGDGLADVQNYFIKHAKPGEWLFPNDVWTDQSAETVITNAVKAKLMDFLPQEVPYAAKPNMDYFKVDEKGVISTVVVVKCPSLRLATLIAGGADGRLRMITESVQKDLQDTFYNYVKIKIVLESPKE